MSTCRYADCFFFFTSNYTQRIRRPLEPAICCSPSKPGFEFFCSIRPWIYLYIRHHIVPSIVPSQRLYFFYSVKKFTNNITYSLELKPIITVFFSRSVLTTLQRCRNCRITRTRVVTEVLHIVDTTYEYPIMVRIVFGLPAISRAKLVTRLRRFV